MKALMAVILGISIFSMVACDPPKESSDRVQQRQQETILQEGTSAVGLPGIKNFREKRILKDILELRDQEGVITYTYVENLNPTVVPGKTILGGKFTFVGQSIGYGIPYATQFTNPEKVQERGVNYGYAILPQADPNGLFSPGSAEGTWIILGDGKDSGVVYIESRITVFPYKVPFD